MHCPIQRINFKQIFSLNLIFYVMQDLIYSFVKKKKKIVHTYIGKF